MLEISSIFLSITAILAYVNHRFLKLPPTIGVMVASLVLSLIVIGLNAIGFDQGINEYEKTLLGSIDFSSVLMQGMLSMLLFAGAMHVDISELKAYKWQVALLAIVGTVLSTLIVGFGLWYFLPFMGINLPLIYCLLFGALISPTDPIAVMGILKTSGAPKNLELVISGESLFNDGVGVVIFSLLLGALASGVTPTFGQGFELFMHEAVGGIFYGLVLGYITFRMIRSIDNYQVEVMLTLASVLGGYALASHLHVSGPLAMVVNGLIIGNGGRNFAMSPITRKYVDLFWELIDEILNAVLFVLIGMEVVIIAFDQNIILAGVAVFALTLVARAITVGAPVNLLYRRFNLPKGSGTVLTWGGLRGGISVALALSLPNGVEKDIILSLTYFVVLCSIIGQGLSVGKVIKVAQQGMKND